MSPGIKIAYFSMEVGIDPAIPTYSGGLGVLAGDLLRTAADMKLSMAGITLLARKGYFNQKLDESGRQTEEPVIWQVEKHLQKLPNQVSVSIEGREVFLAAWQYLIKGPDDHEVPVYFLDADLPQNSEWDRHLTDFLYGGDSRYRICQEVILGMGGVRMLKALGHAEIERYHMNEGHSAFLGLELLDETAAKKGKGPVGWDDVEEVRKKCVFTTHTPVPAGQDQFPMDLVYNVLGKHDVLEMEELFSFKGSLNMTYLALNLSHYVNGVGRRHGEISKLMFGGHTIDSISNGVHAGTWVSKPFQILFDRYIPDWREYNFSFRKAMSIPSNEVWTTHMEVKKRLIDRVKQDTGMILDPEVLTLGFARRAATYKRPDLIFTDINRLKKAASTAGKFQMLFAGKAHPQDRPGKESIQSVFRAIHELKSTIPIAYLPNYELELGQLMTSGADLWLNTPLSPMEASGTSGMKAALNGVPSLSVLDGWWVEGCVEGVTGWAIGEKPPLWGLGPDPGVSQENRAEEAELLYEKLEKTILPLYYGNRERFIRMMLHCIALNGSFFNTQRMLMHYISRAYFS